MVPTQFLRLLKLDDADRSRFDLSSLEWILHTAAPCPAWAKVAMIEWLGPVIFEMYGSSEGTGPAICDSHEWLAHPGTVGKASARIEYTIVDDDGNDLRPGEIGTIYCRRSDGAPEYHGDPDKTASIRLPDGRFTVGDLGWLDDDGYLYLADRRVDLILVAGSNVYPAEIEAVLSEHPSVADVAVFGIPDPEWGEQVKAVIEPVGEVDLDDVRRFAAQRLASVQAAEVVRRRRPAPQGGARQAQEASAARPVLGRRALSVADPQIARAARRASRTASWMVRGATASPICTAASIGSVGTRNPQSTSATHGIVRRSPE